MEAFKYLKLIYSGENSIKRHITLFSIIGLCVLMLNNVISSFGNNLIFSFITTASISNIELFLDFFFGMCLLVLIIGYEYVFIHNVISKDEIALPELEADSYSTFFRMLPIFVIWQLYYTIATVTGGIILTILNNSTYTYIFSAIMLCLTPFVFMLFIKFAYDFKYTKDTFFPWTIFKYLNKCLIKIIILLFQTCIVLALPAFGLIGYTDWALSLKEQPVNLAASLSCICFWAYFFVIFKFIFGIGLAKIVKENFITEE